MAIHVKTKYTIEITVEEFNKPENKKNQAPNSTIEQIVNELVEVTAWDLADPNFQRLLCRSQNKNENE